MSRLKQIFDKNQQSGASLLEVVLVMSIVAVLSPFFFSQISEVSKEIKDVSTAKQIIAIRESALNFVRLNQDMWPDYAQIKLNDEELDYISAIPTVGLIDKYPVQNSSQTDIYLSFSFDGDALRAASIAEKIGADATIVSNDGIAYTSAWAIQSPDFKVGDLIYKIDYDFNNQDTEKYLHKTAADNTELNTMMRPLNMNGFDLYSVGNIISKSAQFDEILVAFAEVSDLISNNIYFTNGADISGDSAQIKTMRVNDDISGFNEIITTTLNKPGYSTSGSIITGAATVYNSVNVGNDLNLNPSSSTSVSGFAGITAHYIETAYLATNELYFHNNFGLTLSSELLMSTETPLRIGSWSFPGSSHPSFTEIELGRVAIPNQIDSSEFENIMDSAWQDLQQKQP